MVTAGSMFGLWTYLFGVSNLAFDTFTSFAPKTLRLDSDGNCQLFDALQKCAHSNSEKQKETWLLMSDIRSNILWDDSFTDDQRMAFTFEKLHGFYVRHSDWLDECALMKVSKGEISIRKFLEAGKMFKQMRNLRKVLGGSPSLLVEYLSMLQDEPTLDSTIREQIRIMVDNLNDYFMEEPRIFKRLEYMAGQTVELLNPQENGVYIEIDLGAWGKFDDLLECYAYYKKHGWQWNDLNEKSVHCSATETLIRLRASDNKTMLTDALKNSWKTWNSLVYRTDFKGYFKRIQNIVEGRVEGLTTAQKQVEIAKILNGFVPNGKQNKELMSVELPNWGTIEEFVHCQSVPFNEQI